ncbi:UNVERIFIED_CONTAM: 7-ethoxycoumarin O-deethylase [Sesamum calycinum]|uniref:7-ethoxycoumarin O-deethylase n=1 Tax=Sesamum calycinum TaxID=2727403 RepID=A0AAW2M104_9LAMI
MTDPSLCKACHRTAQARGKTKTILQMELYGLLLVISTLLLPTYVFQEISNALFIQKKNLPPRPNGLPLIGSLMTIRHRTHESLAKLAKTYGPLMTIKCCHSREGVRACIPLATDRPAVEETAEDFNSHIFMAQKLDSLRHLQHDVVKTAIECVVEAQERGRAIYIGGIVFSTMMKLLLKTLFSADMLDPASDATKTLQVLNANIMVLVAKPNLADYFAFLRPFDPQGISRKNRVSSVA